MKKSAIFLTSLVLAPFALCAAPKVVVWSDEGNLPKLLQTHGVEVLPENALANAEVLVLHGSGCKARVESAQEEVEKLIARKGGLVVLGDAIQAGPKMKAWAGGTWTAQSRKFPSLMMFFPFTQAHPITEDAYAFDIHDETAYDLQLNPAIQVLGSAFTPKVTIKKASHRAPEKLDRANVYDIQPQMWTYEGASGNRAFVLLQASADTLKHDSIRTFLLRGIAWTGRKDSLEGLRGSANREQLVYPHGGARTAEETARSFHLMPGFEVNVIASEPLINKPIAMQFDPQGRLWIAETPEYPNGRRPLKAEPWKETSSLFPGKYERPAKDRISVLSDPDEKGKYRQKTVFHEGLELVTGFCLYKDGVIAIHQPDIVYIHGEGKDQRVERLFTGFTPRDTHFVCNHPVLAPDGWIYVNLGGPMTATGVVKPDLEVKLTGGVFRFKPDGSALEQVGSKRGNGFGLDVGSNGEIFSGQATSGNPIQNMVLPEWILEKAKVGDASSLESTMVGRKAVREDPPTRVPYMQIDAIGGYSAACASTLHEAGAWPDVWKGTIFCTEPILDILHVEKLRTGSANITSEMPNPEREFLRAKDFWFFPVDVQFGPDGAMYVLDFYNPIVAHSDTRGPEHGSAAASIRPDREHYYGRIYRIQHRDAKKLEQINLRTLDAGGLVKAFGHPNKATRFHAQRLLLDRPDAAQTVPALQETARASESVPARILALWSLQRLGQLDPILLRDMLRSGDADLRKTCLLIAESQGTNGTLDLKEALRDSDPRVQLMALRALASRPLTTEDGTALMELLPSLKNHWALSAATAAAATNPAGILVGALSNPKAPSSELLAMAKELTRMVAEKDAESMAHILAALSKVTPEARSLVPVILESAGQRIAPQPPQSKDWHNPLWQVFKGPDPVFSAGVLPFLATWDPEAHRQEAFPAGIDRLLAEASNAQRADTERGAIVRGLLRAKSRDARILPAMVELAGKKISDALCLEVIAALSVNGDPSMIQPLVKVLRNLHGDSQEALFDALISRPPWAFKLLDSMEGKDLDRSIMGPARISKLRFHPNANVAKRAGQLFNQLGWNSNAAKDEIIAKMASEIATKTGDVARGKTTFATVCASCHQFGGQGHEVGPVLDGIGVHGTSELLVHILDPSRVVDNEHRTWNIGLKNGSFVVGIIASENPQRISVRVPGGNTVDLHTRDVQSRKDTGLSLMPEGFEALGADTLADLIAYLRENSGRFRSLNLAAAFTKDTRLTGIQGTLDKPGIPLAPVKYGLVNVEGVPFVLSDPTSTPTGGNGIVLRAEAPGKGGDKLPQKVVVPIGFTATRIHFLGGVAAKIGEDKNVRPAMLVTLEHADGKKQLEELNFGEVFTEYATVSEAPRSKRVNGVVKEHPIRTFSVPVREKAAVAQITLESFQNGIAPVTLAITADTDQGRQEANVPPQPKPARPAVMNTEPLPASGATLPQKAADGTLRVLLAGGGSSHNFQRFFNEVDSATLQASGKCVTAYTENAPEAAQLLERADVLVLSANHVSFGAPAFQRALESFADAGKGVVIVHAGTWYNWKTASEYQKRFVGGGAKSHGRGEFQVIPGTAKHPVLEGIAGPFSIQDEHYRVELDTETAEVLATTSEENVSKKTFPAVWVMRDSKARIVCISLGHAQEAHGNPAYQKLLTNAVRWAGRQ